MGSDGGTASWALQRLQALDPVSRGNRPWRVVHGQRLRSNLPAGANRSV